MMMSARERTRELAVLKTIGFSDRRLFGLVHARGGAHHGHRRGDRPGRRPSCCTGPPTSTPPGFLPGFDVTGATLALGRRHRAGADAGERDRAGHARRAAPGGGGAEERRMKIPIAYNLRSVLPAAGLHRAHRARHRAGGGGVHRHAGAGQRLRAPRSPGPAPTRTCSSSGRAPTPRCRAGSSGTPSASSARRPTSRAARTAGRWRVPRCT